MLGSQTVIVGGVSSRPKAPTADVAQLGHYVPWLRLTMEEGSNLRFCSYSWSKARVIQLQFNIRQLLVLDLL